MTRRFEAQQDMRLALDKLRREIHCANERGALDGSVAHGIRYGRPSRSGRTALRTPQVHVVHLVYEGDAPSGTSSCDTTGTAAVTQLRGATCGRDRTQALQTT